MTPCGGQARVAGRADADAWQFVEGASRCALPKQATQQATGACAHGTMRKLADAARGADLRPKKHVAVALAKHRGKRVRWRPLATLNRIRSDHGNARGVASLMTSARLRPFFHEAPPQRIATSASACCLADLVSEFRRPRIVGDTNRRDDIANFGYRTENRQAPLVRRSGRVRGHLRGLRRESACSTPPRAH